MLKTLHVGVSCGIHSETKPATNSPEVAVVVGWTHVASDRLLDEDSNAQPTCFPSNKKRGEHSDPWEVSHAGLRGGQVTGLWPRIAPRQHVGTARTSTRGNKHCSTAAKVRADHPDHNQNSKLLCSAPRTTSRRNKERNMKRTVVTLYVHDAV